MQQELLNLHAARRPEMPAPAHVPAGELERPIARLTVDGKFFFDAGSGRKVELRGVTYGPFAPDAAGCEYGPRGRVRADFSVMRARQFNAVRLYTTPPPWLLDCAAESNLRVLVGLPWEQHVTFLDSRRRRHEILRRIESMVRACAGHPAVFAYAVGNEIPSSIVRWYGPRRIERWIGHLCDAGRSADPCTLLTYVNYPTTEYLELPFLDFCAFNVYLESPKTQRQYLARLQNIACDRPLVMAEVGLDSMRAGARRQADSLSQQIAIARRCGCAGTFVFSWTDEWHRGGQDILDWKFGLTDRDRGPKPALAAVRDAFAKPSISAEASPRCSVVICTYNGGQTLGETLAAVGRLDYPNFEVIVVDDGSTDDSAQIAARYDVHVIRTPNGGLSSARNIGLHASTGQIIAYLDDDAYPDVDWLTHLAAAFEASPHAGIGGPNIPPRQDGPVADCVSHSPGGPTHVLLSDTEAEHIPGCNMAFRRDALLAIGGFDAQFRIAGDDVDVCWRIQENGGTLGFCPAAVVWHHRRNSVRAYLKQQRNYGRAEAMLERKWPQKYNALGHLTWSGRLYGKGYLHLLPIRRRRIYHGTWGTAMFQSLYDTSPSLIATLPMMPEWHVLTLLFCAAGVLSLLWPAMLPFALIATVLLGASVCTAVVNGWHAGIDQRKRNLWQRLKFRMLAILLHFAQPIARLVGRVGFGLTPWRLRGVSGFAFPRASERKLWSQQWQSAEQRLYGIEQAIRRSGAVVARGGEFDRWDLELRGGIFGGARLSLTLEEHGRGNQLVRIRTWPRMSIAAIAIACVIVAALLLASLFASNGVLAAILATGVLIAAALIREPAAALKTLHRNLAQETPR